MQEDDNSCNDERLGQTSYTDTNHPKTALSCTDMQQNEPAPSVWRACESYPELFRLVKLWPNLSDKLRISILKLVEATLGE